MSKIKNDGLNQYGAGPFEQQQFWTAGVEGVKTLHSPAVNALDVGFIYFLLLLGKLKWNILIWACGEFRLW